MLRVLSALVIGALVAAGIMLILAFFIGGDWVSESTNSDAIAVYEEKANTLVPLRSTMLKDCDLVIDEFTQLVDASRACETDSDCAIASFGCPFGCASAVSFSSLPRLRAAKQSQDFGRCADCVYMCAASPLGSKATCVSNRCQIVPNSFAEFENATREAVTN